MTRYISILRGINVGGKRKMLMTDLKKLYGDLGFSNVVTYIQSGNVIFDLGTKESSIQIADKIEQSISHKYGFEVPVIVRTIPELQQSFKSNPFLISQGVEIERLCLTFLKSLPSEEKLKSLVGLDFHPDKFKIIDKDVFIYYSGKSRDSKLTNNLFEKKLKVSATTRNWKTVRKLVELAQQ